jgi:hypothetical protein
MAELNEEKPTSLADRDADQGVDEDVELGKELLSRLFKSVEISTVVVVDDNYVGGVDPTVLFQLGLTSRADTQAIDDGYDENLRTAFLRELGVELDSDSWAEAALDRLAEMDEEERLALYYQAFERGAMGPRFTDRIAALVVEPTRLIQLSPSGWDRTRERLIADAQKGEIGRKDRTLFLFDLQLGSHDPKGRDGSQLLEELRTATKGTPVLCGVISGEFRVEEEEQYAVAGALGGVPPVYLSKDRLEVHPQTFAEGLRRTAMAEGIQRLIKAALSVLKDAHHSAETELGKLNANNLERVVLELSQQEGIWEADTLFRVYNLHLRRQARIQARTDGTLSAALREVRAVDSIDVTPRSKRKASPSVEARRLQAMELYEEGEDINRFNFPLELGDIFELPDTENLYVLLGQPCDLSLRTRSGKGAEQDVVRTERKLRDPWIARLVAQKPDSKALSAHFHLPVFGSDYTDRWVDFRTAEPASLDILDLAVFNLFGSFTMAVDQDGPQDLLPAWDTRYNELRTHFREGLSRRMQWLAFFDRVKQQEGITPGLVRSETADEVAEEEAVPPIQIPPGEDKVPGIFLPTHRLFPITRVAGDEIVYAGRRVRRLAQPYAGVMLIKFARHRSREAFELNLAR